MVIDHQYRLLEDARESCITYFLTSVGDVECGPAKTVKSVFFDTFDWRLFATGKSVSIRTGQDWSEIHYYDNQRQQTIAVVAGDLTSGFAADFPLGKVRNAVTDIIDVRRLLVRLEVRSRQTRITMRNREGKIVLRLALDRLKARNPEGGRQVSMGTHLTLEPVRGYRKAEARVHKILSKLFAAKSSKEPLHIEGLKAIGVTPGDYSSKLRLSLEPSMTADKAARQIHLNLLDTMQRNEDGMANNIDPEFLHDFRVAVRRTRSALSQLDKDVLPEDVIAKAKSEFRWIGQQTNQMRDMDVYLMDYPKLQETLPEQYRAHLQPFHDYLVAQSRSEIRKVAKVFRGKRYREIRDGWRAYLTDGCQKGENTRHAGTCIKDLADLRIWKVYRSVMKEGKAIDDASPAEALHDLRITCKKLRYLLEFFQSLYPPKEIERLTKSLKAFQNVLGEFQDTELQALAILGIGRELADNDATPVETQMAMGMVADEILQRQRVARAEFGHQFQAFSRRAVRRSFADLFKNQR